MTSPASRHFAQNLETPDSHSSPSLSSLLVAAAVGALALLKALDLLGFPVYLWLHQLALMSRPSSSGSAVSLTASASGDSQQSGVQRSLSNVFGKVTGALTRGNSNAPAGLGNWDNSCYQNSVIQGLASLPSLHRYLDKTTAEHPSLDADSTNGALFDLIKKLNDPENQGQHFWIRGKLKSMSTFQQQDAQEYYSTILDALDKEVQKLSNSAEASEEEDAVDEEKVSEEQPKPAPNPLDGHLAQRVGCVTCGFTEGLSLVPFNCLTVPLGRNSRYDIRDCLDEYTELEYIDNVECAKCTALHLKSTLVKLGGEKPGSPFAKKLEAVQEVLDEEDFDDKTMLKKCGVKKQNWTQATKSRQAVIARAPKALVLHVNRSIFDEITFAQLKNNAAVSYPMILDLGNWCLGSKPSLSQLPDEAEEWPRDPRKSMLENENPRSDSLFQYRLKAAVTHWGSHGNGHYICYRQHPSNLDHSQEDPEDAWFRFSDESVYAVSESQAHQNNVFMLFYERIDESDKLQSSEAVSMDTAVVMPDEAPLPPANVTPQIDLSDETAAEVPLPDEDENDISPPLAAPFNDAETFKPSVGGDYPTPPPSTGYTEISDPESDNQSTLLTSDDEDEPEAIDKDSTATEQEPPQPKLPHVVLRTAGSSSTQNDDRMTAPMVTAS